MNELQPLLESLFTTFVGLPGLCFAILSLMMLKFPPKKINMLYGYRTNSSMKSQQRWDFAQQYSAKIMLKFGIFMLLIALIGAFFQDLIPETAQIIFCVVVILAVIFFLFFKTEKALQQKFN